MERNEIDEISSELEEFLETKKIETEEVVFLEVEEAKPEKKVRTRKPYAYTEECDWIRPSDSLIAAFLVPVIIMIIIFIQRGIYPFGDESFLRTDMYHQYAPFFSEFRDKLAHGGSLLYSWDIGMGINFSALYAYYLASPFNWLLLLCPKGLVIEFMTYSIVLKIGLCGLSFAYYLRSHCKTNDFGIAFFGIFYALSGYMAAYSWNIMWLDCILLFPLIALGLERLVKEKKCMLYCITLGISIVSNYYISIMICFFMVLYFIALLLLEEKKPVKQYCLNVWHFILYSLLAGGLAAAVLIPEIYALQATASSDFSFPKTWESYFPIFDMLARHIGNVEIEIGLDHWPNIYCGVAVFLLFLLYLAGKRVSVKEKVVYCSLLLIFFASFSVNILNFIWHGFHYPNSLPCRQSFIYVFLLLLICYRAYMNLKHTSWRQIVFAFWASICFVMLAEKLVTEEHFHFVVYYVAILFLALYAGLLYWYKQGKLNRNLIAVLVLGTVAIEAAVNTTVTSVTTTSRKAYMQDNAAVKELLDGLHPITEFYRVEKVTRKTKNDGAWLHFPSVSLFSSTANADLSKFFKYLGCESSTNAYSITGSTPLVDSLFSVKFGLYSSEQLDNPLLTLRGSKDDTYLYENAYTLPLAFLMPQNLEDNWQYDAADPIEAQNDLAEVLRTQPIFFEVSGEINGNELRFTPEETEDYYVYVPDKKIEEVTVTIGSKVKNFDNINRGFLLELGYCEAGEEVVIRSDDTNYDMIADVYAFSYNGLASVYEQLNKMPLELTSWTDTSFTGTITADYAGSLYTSIPYDKGWSVWVDGEPRTTRKLFDTFLTVDIPEGEHTLEFKYTPEGLYMGCLITGASVAVLILLWMGGSWAKKKKKTRKESEVE